MGKNGFLDCTREDLLNLKSSQIRRPLTKEEVLHIATCMNSYWQYNYDAARRGRVGLHAELKSGLHSDGFFVSQILLESDVICELMARQMAMRLNQFGIRPDYIAGIPKGATKLGEFVVNITGSKLAIMEKREDQIVLVSEVPDKSKLLFIEDFCTRGTGFNQAVTNTRKSHPLVDILLYNPVILNRGGLLFIVVDYTMYKILAVTDHKINDWEPAECPLCRMGSKPIKPKENPENWQLLINSQY